MRLNRTLLGTLLAIATAAAQAAPAVGQPAPGFSEVDTSGKAVTLADYRGRFVVLEWTNPECPFVRKHYGSGNMPALQKEFASSDVVWLSVNSTREGHSEFYSGAQMAKWMSAQGGAPRAVLIDGDSSTGRIYAAKTTPQMFVIDPQGKLVYAGAIDDRATANPADVKDAKNYVRAALAEAMAGRPVSVASTRPYGCSVKY